MSHSEESLGSNPIVVGSEDSLDSIPVVVVSDWVEDMGFELEDLDLDGLIPVPFMPPPPLRDGNGEPENHGDLLADEMPDETPVVPDRKRLLEMLGDILQALHRAANPYGGLTACTRPDDYPESWQADVNRIATLNGERAKALQLARSEDLTEEDLTRLRKQVSELYAEAGKDIGQETIGYQKAALRAAEDCGLELDAQIALTLMVPEWSSIKITDAPNPYYGDLEAFKQSGLKGEAAALFNPKNRYVHVDGDERVNGAKTAAAKVAVARLPEIDLALLKQEIQDKDGEKLRKRVEKKRGSIEQAVTSEHMLAWYRTTGAKMLEQKGYDKIAALWRKGDDFDADGVPEELTGAITDAAGEVLKTFQDGAMADLVDQAIDTEVEKIIDLTANMQKAKQVEAGQMAQGDYWAEVGRLAKSSDFGRCFSCAGIAIYTFVMNPAFDGLTIESVGAVTYDHHFVLVGRTGDAGSTTPPDEDSKVLVVDVWQANQGGTPPATAWSDFTYNKETQLKVFCVMRPDERKDLRERCEEYAKG